MGLSYVDIELARIRAEISRLSQGSAQATSSGGSGGSGGSEVPVGVSGFSVDANGDLILTYVDVLSDISIDANGDLILEV